MKNNVKKTWEEWQQLGLRVRTFKAAWMDIRNEALSFRGKQDINAERIDKYLCRFVSSLDDKLFNEFREKEHGEKCDVFYGDGGIK